MRTDIVARSIVIYSVVALALFGLGYALIKCDDAKHEINDSYLDMRFEAARFYILSEFGRVLSSMRTELHREIDRLVGDTPEFIGFPRFTERFNGKKLVFDFSVTYDFAHDRRITADDREAIEKELRNWLRNSNAIAGLFWNLNPKVLDYRDATSGGPYVQLLPEGWAGEVMNSLSVSIAFHFPFDYLDEIEFPRLRHHTPW